MCFKFRRDEIGGDIHERIPQKSQLQPGEALNRPFPPRDAPIDAKNRCPESLKEGMPTRGAGTRNLENFKISISLSE